MRPLILIALALYGCVAGSPTPDAPSAFDAGFTDLARAVDAPTQRPQDVTASPGDARGPDAPRTVLRVRYPGGRAMSVRGDAPGALSWTRGVALREAGDGVMEWSSTDVRAPFEWKPLLDDAAWSLGPNYRARPGETTEVWARFTTENGAAQRWRASFSSQILGNSRGIWIYLPPSYAENPARRFPVAYLHDGQNLFDPRASFGGVAWEADDAMNLGAADGTIREAIVVGVENTSARIDEYTPTADAQIMAGGRAGAYLQMLVDELKPEIDREFRTLTGPEHTALLGSSLGGLVSVWIGLRRADVFGAVGAMSPSTWWDGRMILRDVATPRPGATRMRRVWVDSGDSGPSRDGVDDTRALAEALRAAGYRDGETLRYSVQAGASHDERAWRARLPDALRFLLGPRDGEPPAP
ncbi:MAG: alpha/beta hydrolase-fold protein [Polyangiales bacterium]